MKSQGAERHNFRVRISFHPQLPHAPRPTGLEAAATPLSEIPQLEMLPKVALILAASCPWLGSPCWASRHSVGLVPTPPCSSTCSLGRSVRSPCGTSCCRDSDLRLRSGLDHDAAARIIGRHFPDIEDRLLNTPASSQGPSRPRRQRLAPAIAQRAINCAPTGSPLPWTSGKTGATSSTPSRPWPCSPDCTSPCQRRWKPDRPTHPPPYRGPRHARFPAGARRPE